MSIDNQVEEITAVDVYDQVTLAKNVLGWLGAISTAMEDAAAVTQHDRRHQIKELASLSKYLCADWHNHFDIAAADLAKKHGFSHP